MAIAERITLEEFLALPEEEPALEFEDGRTYSGFSRVPDVAVYTWKRIPV